MSQCSTAALVTTAKIQKQAKCPSAHEWIKKKSGCFTHTHIHTHTHINGVSQVVLVVKNLPANAGDVRDMSLILGSEGSPGGGRGNPFQYSRLENPVDRGASQATVHRLTKSQT